MNEIQIITPPVADETDALDRGLVVLTEAINQIDPDCVAHGALGGEFGYGADFENDVFVMRRFYWGDCTCGADERGEKWHAENPHAPNCFREELHRRFAKYDEESGYNAAEAACHAEGTTVEHTEETEAGPFHGTMTWTERTSLGEAAHKAWCKAHDKRDKAHERLTKQLYKERGIKSSPYQWLCTCGVDERAKSYFATEGHYQTCAVKLPNFRHKRTGLEVRWYKWIGRDTETEHTDGADLQAIFAECIASLIPASR